MNSEWSQNNGDIADGVACFYNRFKRSIVSDLFLYVLYRPSSDRLYCRAHEHPERHPRYLRTSTSWHTYQDLKQHGKQRILASLLDHDQWVERLVRPHPMDVSVMCGR